MGGALLKGGGAFPLEEDVVAGGVEGALDEGGVGVGGDELRGVERGLGPVVGIVGMTACGVGEAQGDSSALVLQQLTLDAGVEGILSGVNACGDFYQLAIGLEGGLYLAIEDFLFLTDVGEGAEGNLTACGILEIEADGTEVKTMGIDTEILCSLLVATILGFLKLYGIHLRVPMAEIE